MSTTHGRLPMCYRIEKMGDTNAKGCGCCGGGIFGSIGAVLAALLSWSVNHSILWALVHAFLSWFYVVYHWIVYGKILP
jgi:hypothetical protein